MFTQSSKGCTHLDRLALSHTKKQMKLPMNDALFVWIYNITILCKSRVYRRRIISNQLGKPFINPTKPLLNETDIILALKTKI